jgi:hypothetical protein
MLVLATASLGAQDTVPTLPDIPLATRVRIRAEGLPDGFLVGKVTEMDSVRIGVAVTDNSSVAVIPWRMISTMEFSQGKDRTTGARNGALLGIAAGAIVFTSLLRQAQRDPTGDETQLLANISFRAVPALGAGVGALLGKERWWAVPPYRRAVRDEEYATGIRLLLSQFDEVRVSSTVAPARGRFVSDTSDTSDTLTLRRGNNLSRLAWPTITALRVRGNERDRVYGALIGASLASGAVAVGESISPRSQTTDAAITFLIAGAIGGFIGSEFAPRKWILLPLPKR